MDNKWPKKSPILTEEQKRIKADFMKYWHEVLPAKYTAIERFNHGFPAKNRKQGGKTLEIGAGLGEHIKYENLSGVDYYALEILPNMAEVIKKRYPQLKVIVGDCEKELPFEKDYFDKVVAIHVLEHLADLPAALREIQRVLKPTGEFYAVIPCEGGLLHALAREISAKRIFVKRYKMKYDWLIKTEHVNKPREIILELKKKFQITKKTFFPFFLPSVAFNLVIGLILKPRK
jgi:SAM-dependent methyltransferase